MTSAEQSYRVDLLLAEHMTVPRAAFEATLQQLLPDSSGIVVSATQEGVTDDEDAHAALSQTWDWPEAGDALHHAVATISITVAADPDRFARIHRLNAAVRALLNHVPVAAIHWLPAQRLIEPQGFIAGLAHGGTITDHAVNVRLFRIPDGRDGELLMDTLGLAPFGLPDLQCHFAGADPAKMGALLAGYADYLFDKGDVLNDDSLVRGIASHDEWPCAREESLAAPPRPVIDFRPDDLWVPT